MTAFFQQILLLPAKPDPNMETSKEMMKMVTTAIRNLELVLVLLELVLQGRQPTQEQHRAVVLAQEDLPARTFQLRTQSWRLWLFCSRRLRAVMAWKNRSSTVYQGRKVDDSCSQLCTGQPGASRT
jgi:hypothetical protein